MSNQYGHGQIVTDDISLCLDAGDSSSYPGSGTTWTDLANGIVFSSVGTTTPFGTVAGSPALTFNASGYWQSTGGTSESDKVDMGGDCTLIMWLYADDRGSRHRFRKSGNFIYFIPTRNSCNMGGCRDFKLV